MSKTIEVHVIQSYPPNKMNADEGGNQKTALFGGIQRARISSQCQKHFMRLMNIKEHLTSRLADIIIQRSLEINPSMPESDQNKIRNIDIFKSKKNEDAKGKGRAKGKKIIDTEDSQEDVGNNEVDATVDKSDALIYVSCDAIEKMAQLAASGNIEDEKIKDILATSISENIALFGRMIASYEGAKIEGSVCVAHAISTHEFDDEWDYFVGIDSLKNTQGAEIIGDVNFGSFTAYRYANLNMDLLRKNMGSETSEKTIKEIVGNFVKNFVALNLGGKKNSFACFTPPSFVLVIINDGQPVQLTDAFLNPVKSDFINESAKKLMSHYKKYEEFFSPNHKSFVWNKTDVEMESEPTIDSMIKKIEESL